MFNPVSDTSKNHPAAAFIKAIEKENDEYRYNLPGPQPWLSSAELQKMTQEERDFHHERQRLQWEVSGATDYYFREIVSHAPRPTYLIALPEAMARDESLGSNVLLRYILSLPYRSELAPEDHEIVKHIRTLIVAPRYDPGLRDTMRTLIRNSQPENDYTLAEFYWLYRLCDWLGCLENTMTAHLTKLLGENGDNIETVDFRKKLSNDTDELAAILMMIRYQYIKLEELLRRI